MQMINAEKSIKECKKSTKSWNPNFNLVRYYHSQKKEFVWIPYFETSAFPLKRLQVCNRPEKFCRDGRQKPTIATEQQQHETTALVWLKTQNRSLKTLFSNENLPLQCWTPVYSIVFSFFRTAIS